MPKTRSKKNLLLTPMSKGFFADMPNDISKVISLFSPVRDAAALAKTSKQLYATLRQTNTRRYLQSMSVVDVVGSHYSTFLVTSGGEVFACGSNYHANLALGAPSLKVVHFRRIPQLDNIRQVAIFGDFYTLFITHAGKVFSVGGMNSVRRLNQFIQPSCAPAEVLFGREVIAKMVTYRDSVYFLTKSAKVYVLGEYLNSYLCVPTLIPAIPSIRDIVQDGGSLYLLTTDNQLYAAGSNDRGQLGVGDRQRRPHFVRIPLLDNVKSIQSVNHRVYALTFQGQVYAWGNNINGLLGFGDGHEHNAPALLTTLANIETIEIGEEHFFATVNGRVYCFGSNTQGELGLGDCNERLQPVLNPALQGIKEVTSRPFSRFTLFTTAESCLYANGCLLFQAEWAMPAHIERYIKAEPQAFYVHDRVEQVSSQYYNSIWRTHDGAIYVIGLNSHGGLGLVNSGLIAKPTMVLFPAVKKIIKEASVADLLFYSQSERGYARYCYQQAMKKIEVVQTAPQLLDILQELNLPAWNNCADIKAILPAYHLVLRYANDRNNQQNAKSVTNAWAKLLVMYRDFASKKSGDPYQLREFMGMLREVAEPQYNASLFKPPVQRRSGHELLAQLQADPAALRIAAKLLVPELPPCPPPVSKRKAEDEPANIPGPKKLKR